MHGGYDPRTAFFARTWLGWAYVVARPLVRIRVAPELLTLSGGLISLGVVGLAGLGERWALLAAAVVVGAALLDSLDGAVAMMTGSTSAWGSVLDSVVDRVSDALYLLALWVLGSPGWLCVFGGVAMALLEYLRASAASAGMREIGVVTVWERPSRVVVTAIFLACGALLGPSIGAWVTGAAALWAGMGMVGFVQLAVVVRRRLADPPGPA
jgi:phosphatidylglycerophosphate synthase